MLPAKDDGSGHQDCGGVRRMKRTWKLSMRGTSKRSLNEEPSRDDDEPFTAHLYDGGDGGEEEEESDDDDDNESSDRRRRPTSLQTPSRLPITL